MTNEDAIKILKEHCYVYNPLDFDITIMINTAIDKAIIALLQQNETETQKIQELEQAQLEKAYELGKSEGSYDEIMTEIERQQKWLYRAGYTAHNIDIAFDTIKSVVRRSEEQ